MMDAMETGILAGASWHEMTERVAIESFKVILRLASAYLTVCYGLPANALEFIKENR